MANNGLERYIHVYFCRRPKKVVINGIAAFEKQVLNKKDFFIAFIVLY
jgi:hypothetical protein